MSGMANMSMGESGLDSVRFGGGIPALERCELADVLPILIRIEHKSEIRLYDLSKGQLTEIVNVCSGMSVETRASTELSALIRVGLEERVVEISQDAAGGLCDVIFAAVLLRVFHDEANAGMSFGELIDEARLTLLDELPHALGYSGADELECDMMEGRSVLLRAHYYVGACTAPLALRERVVEHRAVSLHAA